MTRMPRFSPAFRLDDARLASACLIRQLKGLPSHVVQSQPGCILLLASIKSESYRTHFLDVCLETYVEKIWSHGKKQRLSRYTRGFHITRPNSPGALSHSYGLVVQASQTSIMHYLDNTKP